MCKGLYRLATNCEMNVNSPIVHNAAFVLLPQIHLANEQTEHFHVAASCMADCHNTVCSDTFDPLGFFSK